MSKLINAVKGIGEYFFGTSTHKFYNDQRKFYRQQAELMKDMEIYNDVKDNFAGDEAGSIIVGKFGPDIFTLIGGGMVLISAIPPRDPNYFGYILGGTAMVIGSEIFRNYFKNIIETDKTKTKIKQAKFKDNLESKTDSIGQQ